MYTATIESNPFCLTLSLRGAVPVWYLRRSGGGGGHIAGRGGDDCPAPASRAGGRWAVGRCGGGAGAGPPPPIDRRSVAGGPSADGVPWRTLCDRLQRRNL